LVELLIVTRAIYSTPFPLVVQAYIKQTACDLATT